MADKQGSKLTSNLRNGITGAFAKKEDTYNGKDMQAASLMHLVGGAVVGGVVARYRAEKGKPAIAKVFF